MSKRLARQLDYIYLSMRENIYYDRFRDHVSPGMYSGSLRPDDRKGMPEAQSSDPVTESI
jgi:hypothetical protein